MRKLILTGEHAGNQVPTAYAKLFQGKQRVLESHRGWDPGSLSMAKTFQRRLDAPLFYATFTRLLVEPNRSLSHRRLFSEFTADLDDTTKQALLDGYYHPHRNRIESWIAEQTSAGHAVVHLSLHTFTPKLNGQVRSADVGLLYDPGRSREQQICEAWKMELLQLRSDLCIRRNYPYLGKADGLTTYLRKRMPTHLYAGIELEVNQSWPRMKKRVWQRLQHDLADSFAQVVDQLSEGKAPRQV